MHGSGGVYNAELDFWPKQFNAAGIAVFTLDMFGPRGVQSTYEDQSKVPFPADTADAFAALRLLATHPRIDAKRIAVMGFSRGGIAALRTSVERIDAARKLPEGLRYAAAISTYGGGCTGVFRLVVKPGVFSKAPILFLHGDADDYTPIAPCLDYADKIGKARTMIEFVTLERRALQVRLGRPQALLPARRDAHESGLSDRDRHRHALRVRPHDRKPAPGRRLHRGAEELRCRGKRRSRATRERATRQRRRQSASSRRRLQTSCDSTRQRA